MDPDETLRTIRRLSAGILATGDDGDGEQPATSDDAIELAEAVRHLDAWLCRGGFLPKRWQR